MLRERRVLGDTANPPTVAAEVGHRPRPGTWICGARCGGGTDQGTVAHSHVAAERRMASRTSITRLQRVYDKLGVSGRSELARSLEP